MPASKMYKGSERMTGGVLPALLLSTMAGLSTTVGSLIAMFSKRDDTRFLSVSLGFSAGVMIAVSFAELLPEAEKNLGGAMGAHGSFMTILYLALGLALAALIDIAIPENGSCNNKAASKKGKSPQSSLLHMGIVTAVAITVHNFPEGIATFMAGYADIRIGLPVALSIALHNIPEGIAVAVPVFYGTGSRAKAFLTSALSGLSEPLGALLAYFCLAPFMNAGTLGAVFAAVAGIMLYIAFTELIPASESYSRPRTSVAGIISGALVMLIAMMAMG
jgi:ZIP family zinc transporter